MLCGCSTLLAHRVVQWTTGNVGTSSVRAIVANPGLELVGCFAFSPDKVGRDVGELCGLDPVGVVATDDVDALLALEPDCVVYNPMWSDVDELVRILSAGVNVVSTAAFITGHNLGADRDRIVEACQKGGSTILGSGISPGFIELLAIVSSTICDRVDKITISEVADSTFYDSPLTEIPAGFGSPIDDPDLQAKTAHGTAVFGEAVRLVADALGVELDDITCEGEYAQTTEDLDLGSWTIQAGCVAGVAASWKGWVGGKDVVQLDVRWRKGQTLEPDWKVDHDGWKIQIDGMPTVTLDVGLLPPPDFQAETIEEFMVIGHVITAMPPINAIPAVVAAEPGHRDLQRPAPGAPPRRGVLGLSRRRRPPARPATRSAPVAGAAPICKVRAPIRPPVGRADARRAKGEPRKMEQVPMVGYLVLGDEPHLVANECEGCGARFFDRRNACASCGSTAGFRSVDIDREGELLSYTIVSFAAPGIDVPFVAGIVDCGGTTVRGNVVGTTPDPDHVTLGMKLRLATFPIGTDSEGTEAVGFGFEPVEKS